MRALVIILLLLSIGTLLTGQEVEPEEPGIVLPPMLLEVEDLQVEDVQAVLPEDELQLRPEISIPLPDAEELYLPEDTFDIPYPDQITAAVSLSPITTSPQEEQIPRREIFSEGQIGVGLMSHVIGDISLFKLGQSPRFTLGFFHKKIDGYGFREAGSGYSHIDDVLDGSFAYTEIPVDFEIDGWIAEHSEGLQGRATYGSVTHRFIGGDASFGYEFSDIFRIDANLGADYTGQVLSEVDPTEDPLSGYELAAKTAISGSFVLGPVDLSLRTEYEFVSNLNYNDESRTLHDIAALLMISVTLPLDFVISAEGGAIWNSVSTTLGQQAQSDGFIFPFALRLNGSIGTFMGFATSGGYRREKTRYHQLWRELPLLDHQLSRRSSGAGAVEPFQDSIGWFWQAELLFRIARGFNVTTAIDFGLPVGAVEMDTSQDDSTGLFGYKQSVSNPMTQLKADIALEWNIGQGFETYLSYGAEILDHQVQDPTHEVTLGFLFDHTGGRVGAYVDATMKAFMKLGAENIIGGAESLIPFLNLGGYYRVAEGVAFSLEATDLLSPAITNGRLYWPPYFAPGLQIVVKTQISL